MLGRKLYLRRSEQAIPVLGGLHHRYQLAVSHQIFSSDGLSSRHSDLVLPKTAPSLEYKTVDVYAFHDPAFKQPWGA